MKNKQLFTSNSNEWYTPQYIIDWIEEHFQEIYTDPCASKHSKIGRINYTIEENGLTKPWRLFTFVNPPYGRDIKKWIKKAYEESKKSYNCGVVMLIPARTDTTYWHEYIFNKANIFFIKGRIKFLDEDLKERDAATFPSALVLFNKEEWHYIDALDFKRGK